MSGMNIVPFQNEGALPAYLQTANPALAEINKDVVRAAAFPNMSIKGKVFTMVKDGVRKLLTKPDEPDEVAQSIGVVILRANMKSHVLYLKEFVEGQSDGARPDCYTYDGVAPSPNSPNPQAKKCAVCPHYVWGSRISRAGEENEGEKKGRACGDYARMAIAAPDKLDEPMLLRVPAGSLKNWREAVKVIDARAIPYNAVVMKISFDPEKASPTLRFKPVGLLGDKEYALGSEQYDSEIVRAIVGADDHGQEASDVAAAAAPLVSGDELDAALAARSVADKAKAAAAPAPAAAPAAEAKARRSVKAQTPTSEELDAALGTSAKPAAAAAPTEAPAPAPTSGAAGLLSDLDELLGGKDD